MKNLYLSNSDKIVLVDDKDYDRVFNYSKWILVKSKSGDTITSSIYTGIVLGRFILGLKSFRFDKRIADHKDGNIFDCRRSNLRIATKQQNQWNTKLLSKHNTSGYKGVCWFKTRNKWMTKITLNNKTIFIGYFDCIIQAALAY